MGAGSSAAQEAEREAKKKRRQIGALVIHKEHVRQLFEKLKRHRLQSCEGGVAVPVLSVPRRGEQMQQVATAAGGRPHHHAAEGEGGERGRGAELLQGLQPREEHNIS
jgi:hypothetical protein